MRPVISTSIIGFVSAYVCAVRSEKGTREHFIWMRALVRYTGRLHDDWGW